MKKTVCSIALFCACLAAHGQNFGDWFTDRTLRVDYVFTGDYQHQDICLDELSSLPQWAGRRHHLSELPLAGNGDIEMKDKASGKVIYRTSFSSLFQEWLGEAEAKEVKRSFENSFLLPYPKEAATVTVRLKNARQEVCASLTHEVNPKDILIHQRGNERITPHRYLLQSGTAEDCIDVAILAEGYTQAEMDLFYKDAEIACEALFDHEPFKHLKDRFNIVAVASPSQDSGVSVPRRDEWKSTAVSSHFDTFYSDRYLTTRSVKAIHNWLAGIPYEHIIILANTDTYGGGGIYNSYTLTTTHNPYDIEPCEQNITTLVNFESKWKDMLPEGTPVPTPVQKDPEKIYTQVGVYEGAGYSLKGIYRPTTECRMKINEAPRFCPVCERAIERLINFYTK